MDVSDRLSSRTEDGFTVSPVSNGFVLESMERLNSESFVGKKKRSYAFPRTKFHEHRLVPSRDYMIAETIKEAGIRMPTPCRNPKRTGNRNRIGT